MPQWEYKTVFLKIFPQNREPTPKPGKVSVATPAAIEPLVFGQEIKLLDEYLDMQSLKGWELFTVIQEPRSDKGPCFIFRMPMAIPAGALDGSRASSTPFTGPPASAATTGAPPAVAPGAPPGMPLASPPAMPVVVGITKSQSSPPPAGLPLPAPISVPLPAPLPSALVSAPPPTRAGSSPAIPPPLRMGSSPQLNAPGALPAVAPPPALKPTASGAVPPPLPQTSPPAPAVSSPLPAPTPPVVGPPPLPLTTPPAAAGTAAGPARPSSGVAMAPLPLAAPSGNNPAAAPAPTGAPADELSSQQKDQEEAAALLYAIEAAARGNPQGWADLAFIAKMCVQSGIENDRMYALLEYLENNRYVEWSPSTHSPKRGGWIRRAR